MKTTVQGLNFDLTPAIVGHVKGRLGKVLDAYAPRVRSIIVRLSDVNGARGGHDKRCLLEARAEGVGHVRVEEVDADLYRSVDRAAARLRRMLAREFGRHRTRRLGPRVSASGLPT